MVITNFVLITVVIDILVARLTTKLNENTKKKCNF